MLNPNNADTAEADIDRLFEATNSRLETNETSRRRANIEHLKAAVAARSAEDELGGNPADADGDDTADYRDDLARVMRPRRVRVDVSRRNRTETRPTPLVLVSEQRVDGETPAQNDEAPIAPVRPRRVRSSGLALAEQAETEMAAPRPLDATERPVSEPTAEFAQDAPAIARADLPESADVVTEAFRSADQIEAETPPAPRKVARGLADLAARAGQMMGVAGSRRDDAAKSDDADRAIETATERTADLTEELSALADASAAFEPMPEIDTPQPVATDLPTVDAEAEALELNASSEIELEAVAEPAVDEIDTSAADAAQGSIDTSTGFGAYLAQKDHETMEDQMELAAAYAMHEEDRAVFSRPHILRHLEAANGGNLDREDGLRAFGILLREGIIEKIARGEFKLTRRSRYYRG